MHVVFSGASAWWIPVLASLIDQVETEDAGDRASYDSGRYTDFADRRRHTLESAHPARTELAAFFSRKSDPQCARGAHCCCWSSVSRVKFHRTADAKMVFAGSFR